MPTALEMDLVSFAASFSSSSCLWSVHRLADQLQWNPLDVCIQAVQAIAQQPLLLSYCSLADADYIQVWYVQDAAIVETSADGLFEVVVLARRLLVSQQPLSSVESPVHANQWWFKAVRDTGWAIEGIDLAYVYAYTGGNSFQCLGKALDLDCRADVETIRLPRHVMKMLLPRTCLGSNLNLQPFHFLLGQRTLSLPRW